MNDTQAAPMRGAKSEVITAAILVIGDEILSGRTKDKNIGYIAEYLTNIGIDMREVRVVPDIEDEIVTALDALRHRYTYVFTTGGIGPTHDDITSATVAKAFGVPIMRSAEAVRRMERHYPAGQLTPARLKMTEVPEGSTLIDNPISTAPGFQIGNVFVLAGVPNIAHAMFDGVKHRLKAGPPVLSRAVACNLPEGAIAEGLTAIQDRHASVEIGSYPFYRRGGFGTSLVSRGTDAAELEQVVVEIRSLIEGLGGIPGDDVEG